MKKTKGIILVLATVLGLASCEKDNSVAPGMQSQTDSDYLTLSSDQYEGLKSAITKEYEGATTSTEQNKFDLTNFKPQSSTVITETDIAEINKKMQAENAIEKMIKNNEVIIAKFPELANHTSMLTVYNQALALSVNDKSQLRSFVEKHSYFLTYLEEFNVVMLTVPKYKAALLSPNGLIKIDNQIIQYGDDAIRIIKNGDANLVKDLQATMNTTENFEVVKTSEPNLKWSRASTVSAVKYYGTTYPLYLCYVVVSKYIDTEVYTVYSNGTYKNVKPCTSGCTGTPTSTNYVKYSVGSELAIGFNGQAFYAPNAGLYSVNKCVGRPSQNAYAGVVNNFYAKTPGAVFNAWNGSAPATTTIPYSNFTVTATWHVVYGNGIVFDSNVTL